MGTERACTRPALGGRESEANVGPKSGDPRLNLLDASTMRSVHGTPDLGICRNPKTVPPGLGASGASGAAQSAQLQKP